jgi:hypothetical protein
VRLALGDLAAAPAPFGSRSLALTSMRGLQLRVFQRPSFGQPDRILLGVLPQLSAHNLSRVEVMTIHSFASAYRLQVKRDPEDGTPVIPGRKGKSHLFEYDDGVLGVLLMPEAGTAHWWNAALAAFLRAGMEIIQDFDQEGVATFDPENPEQVRLALKYADVRRRRSVSEAQRQRLAQIGFKKVVGAVLHTSQSDFANTVEGEKTL